MRLLASSVGAYTTDPIVSAVLSVLSCKARQIGGIAGNVETDEVLYVVVSALFRFIDRETVLRARGSCPIRVDYRVPSHHAMQKDEIVECVIHDARPSRAQPTLESAGFQLVHRSSAVRDWFDSDEVIRVYYEECKALARELTGASQAFTFDHLIREPGRQTGGGGLFKQDVVTTAERGGGYISLVHMDYTDSSTWNEYLALHGISEPERASRIIVLNFWRLCSALRSDNRLRYATREQCTPMTCSR